jgi:GH3 auxin-responsive promoter
LRADAWLGNTIWQLSAFRDWWSFAKQSSELERVQLGLLRESLGRLSFTDYGRGLGVTANWSYELFRECVPLASYQELQPFLAYESGLLNEPVRVWEPTGGSTGGSKWIPWTSELQTQFRRAIHVWIFELFRRRPKLKRGRGYWQLTPKATVVPPDWLDQKPTGFESDGDYLGWLGRRLEKWVTVQIRSQELEFWESMLKALTKASDLTLISCWSPSFLQVLKQKMAARYGCWSPAEWWPNLQLISCWTHGPSATHRSAIEKMFPGVEIQGKGLLSTEAVTTVPVGQLYPLAYQSHFFEFLAECGAVHPSWELERGQRYQVLQTTAGGLVRYRSGDWVQVTDFYGQVPCLEFLSRDGVCDRFGEKLSLGFLQNSLSKFNRFAKLGFEDGGYVLFLDSADGASDCYHSLNRAMKEVFTYRDCLDLGQLQELRLFVLEDSDQISQHLDLQEGRRKPSLLLPDGVWSARLKGEFFSV